MGRVPSFKAFCDLVFSSLFLTLMIKLVVPEAILLVAKLSCFKSPNQNSGRQGTGFVGKWPKFSVPLRVEPYRETEEEGDKKAKFACAYGSDARGAFCWYDWDRITVSVE